MITVLGTPRRSRTDRGWKIQGYFQFSTTDLTGVLPIDTVCPRIVGGIKLFPQGPTTFTAQESIQYDAGTVSASAAFLMTANRTGSISAASFVVDTTVATHASNIWTVGVINTTATLTPVDIADPLNSNTTTTGAAFTADTPRALTLGAAAQLLVTDGDVLEWTFTKAASAANLVELSLRLDIVPTTGLGVREQVYPDVAALIATSGGTAGYLVPTVLTTITPNGPAVNIVRRGTAPTSNLIVAFEYEGF